MNKKIFEDKKIIVLIILIVMTLILSIINFFTKESNNNKYLKNKDYVFTVDKVGNSKLPFINIDSEEIQNINDEIEKKYYKATTSKLDTYLTYIYNIKNNFISILITEKEAAYEDDIPDINYYSYYIDINNKKIYTKEEILNKFNIDSDLVKTTIDKSIEEQYNKEVKEGYIVYQECGLTCYKELRHYTGIDNINFYIENNKVYGYLNITNKVYYYTNDIYPEYKYKFSF